MRSVLAGLRRLVIPWGATGSTPRVEIGGDIPAALRDWYLVSQGALFNSVLAARIAYVGTGRYYFDVLLSTNTTPVLEYRVVGYFDESVGTPVLLSEQRMDRTGTPGVSSQRLGDRQVFLDIEANGIAVDCISVPGSITVDALDIRLRAFGAGNRIRLNEALTADINNQLRAARDDWVTTSSSANVRIFTGDAGNDARIGVSTSAQRFKQDIEPARIGGADLVELQPVTFRDRGEVEESGDAAGWHLGLVAEQVDRTGLGPYLVDRDPTGQPWSVQYDRLAVALLAVVQDQARQIEQLSARVDALQPRDGSGTDE